MILKVMKMNKDGTLFRSPLEHRFYTRIGLTGAQKGRHKISWFTAHVQWRQRGEGSQIN